MKGWSFSQAKLMQAEERGNSRKCQRERKLGQILSVRAQLPEKEERRIESIPRDEKYDVKDNWSIRYAINIHFQITYILRNALIT